MKLSIVIFASQCVTSMINPQVKDNMQFYTVKNSIKALLDIASPIIKDLEASSHGDPILLEIVDKIKALKEYAKEEQAYGILEEDQIAPEGELMKKALLETVVKDAINAFENYLKYCKRDAFGKNENLQAAFQAVRNTIASIPLDQPNGQYRM